ncbi:hypothetical protein ACIG47_02180 [Promicromonospora sp. NPDC052451]|uniref:hypothetical protein n=1 Tax=Promicromonospora sp. NPDC052451 TaxID=3364407 RepID=UPI0037C5EB89
MNRTMYDDLHDLAPGGPVDVTGLEVARAAFERGLRAGAAVRVGGRKHLAGRNPRRGVGAGRVLVALTAGVLLLGTGALGATLLGDASRPAQVGVPEPSRSPTPAPSTTPDGGTRGCDDRNEVLDATPPVPSAQWPGLIDHGWRLPDVPVTAAPTLQSAPVRCAGEVAALAFADVEDDRAVVVYSRHPNAVPPDADISLAEASIGTVGGGDHFVTWTDGHGRSWSATAGGVSAEELRTILQSLDFAEDGAVTGPVPHGLERVETPEVDPGTTVYLWRMRHDDVSSYLWVTWPVTAPIEAGLADGRDYTAVEFDGRVALYSPGIPGLSANPPSLRWVEDGARFWLLDADADLELLKARARSVEPIALDDPELRPYLGR